MALDEIERNKTGVKKPNVNETVANKKANGNKQCKTKEAHIHTEE